MNVPNLRFPQFKEPWMNYKASELLTTVSTNSLSWEQLTYAPNSSFKNLHYGLIHNGFETTGITGQSNLLPYINPSFLPTKYTLIQDGDLILADASEDRKDVGKPVEMLDVRNQKVVSGLHTIHAKNKTNLISIGFKGFYFQSEAMKKQIFKIANGSKIFGISATNFNELNMCIPSHPEQKIIVDLMGKIESRIQTQIKIIKELNLLIKALRNKIFNNKNLIWLPLKDLTDNETIVLKRGNIIPKHNRDDTHIYPVYSSSITNGGLMGYSDTYMFDKELITWSIDGGGNFFYREKHKYSVTNVCGYMTIDENLLNYTFVSNALMWQHEHYKFDYQSKAHPSVIESMYKIPVLPLNKQIEYAKLFNHLYNKLKIEQTISSMLSLQKTYLLKNMFV